MKKNARLEKRRTEISEDVKLFVDKSFEIVDQISGLLKERGLTQKDLAKILGKEDSEISKWMSGTHNFTLKTIAKLEIALRSPLVCCTKQSVREYNIFITNTNIPFIMNGAVDYTLQTPVLVMSELYIAGSATSLNTKLFN